jgi:D-alanine-D-alanine ligase
MSKKINVTILCGGQSAEHKISLLSAKNIIESIDKDKYNPILIGIDKSGNCVINNTSNLLLNSDNPKLIELNTAESIVEYLPSSLDDFKHNRRIDVVFPILHGPFGEDGTIQGLLKLTNIPFVGADVLGSAIGMDKDIMKRLLRDAGIPIAKFITLKSSQSIPSFQTIIDNLGSPVFIKPANMGSSIGVNKVTDENSYNNAIENAFEFDNKIIIEEFIKGREIECAILGNDNPIASIPGEIIVNTNFYSYDAKYIDQKGADLQIPAKIPDPITEQIQSLAIKTFQTLSCECLARVDFFLTDDGQIFVNEINTLPGFTKTSMYPKLWEVSGISYPDLIDQLIQLAFERFNKHNNYTK